MKGYVGMASVRTGLLFSSPASIWNWIERFLSVFQLRGPPLSQFFLSRVALLSRDFCENFEHILHKK